MNLEFPYQLVAFLDTEPKIGEPVYYGENGWYPQIALKRRFKLEGIGEEELIEKIAEFCEIHFGFSIQVKESVQPERMPVKVLEVETSSDLLGFHTEFIDFMGDKIASRYPERDGANYYPHITLEYNDKAVVDETLYENKEIIIEKIFLLKDVEDENSIAFKSFNLQ